MNHPLIGRDSLVVRQVLELAEVFGYETRNKYRVLDQTGREVMFVAEQQKGILAFLSRQIFGHWRNYSLNFYDEQKNRVMEGRHPFRFWFERLDVYDAGGTFIGAIQQRFTIMRRRFDVLDAQGGIVMSVRTKIVFFTTWTFPFVRGGIEVARVEKKFSGLLQELYTDADNFLVSFLDASMGLAERQLVLAAAIFIDLMYFEVKAESRST